MRIAVSTSLSQQAQRYRQASWKKWVDKHAAACASAAHKLSKLPPGRRPSQLVEGSVLNRAQPAVEPHKQWSDIWQMPLGRTGHKRNLRDNLRWPDIANGEWGTPSVGILRKSSQNFLIHDGRWLGCSLATSFRST